LRRYGLSDRRIYDIDSALTVRLTVRLRLNFVGVVSRIGIDAVAVASLAIDQDDTASIAWVKSQRIIHAGIAEDDP
jgi:hypothetical protein